MESDEIIDIDLPASPTNKRSADHLTGTTGNYSWEEEYKRSWDVIQEDESGSLSSVVDRLQQQLKRKRLLRDTRLIQRGIIRHLIVILDLSESIQEKDLRPSRHDLTLSYLEAFVVEYFDQNPISQLGIVVTRGAKAEMISELSGNPIDHINALKVKANTTPHGEPSLQNALILARGALSHVPSHGTREIITIFSATATCDPGNIHDPISQLKNDLIRVNVVGLAAELHICKILCQETNGVYSVALHEVHYKDILWECILTPAITTSRRTNTLMTMGFPEKSVSKVPSLCSCHGNPTMSGFHCPRCQSKLCNIPTDCAICNLTLVSSPHLARSYHHLFPIPNFTEVDSPSMQSTSECCFSCLIPFDIHNAGNINASKAALLSPDTPNKRSKGLGRTKNRFECPSCHQHFCIDCDLYIHEVLHNCPGCCML